jgi:hypothetical protein
MKVGSLIDWNAAVVPAIGQDGDKGVQATAR